MEVKTNLKPVSEEAFENFLGSFGLQTDVSETVEKSEEELENEKKETKAKPNNVLANNEVKFSILDLEEEEDNKTNTVVPTANNTVKTNTEKPVKSTEEKEKNFNSIIEELYEEEVLFPFDDEEDGKKFEIKSAKELKELIEANKKEWKRQAIEEEFEEEFKMLPSEVQLLTEYIKRGGTDVKGVLKELTVSQEIRDLDPEAQPKEVVKQYLSLTTELSDEEIQEQIEEWEDLGNIEKKALNFKPKLEKLREKKEQDILKEQEKFLEKQRAIATKYVNGITSSLKEKDINGIKLTREEQTEVYKVLTEQKYTSAVNGASLNFLGKFLEEIMWEKPDYKTLVELALFAKDKEAYRNKIRESVKEEVTAEMEKRLKTTRSNLVTTTDEDGKEKTGVRKVISRNGGLLRRNF